jgi:hypothetical protein
MRSPQVGDLVYLRDRTGDDPVVKHHGAGIVTHIQAFDQSMDYPHISVKWLRSEETHKFLEKDLMVLHEA